MRFCFLLLAQVVWAQPYVVHSLTDIGYLAGYSVSVPALSAHVGYVTNMLAGRQGDLYLLMESVYRIDATGSMTRILGNGTLGYGGEANPGVAAQWSPDGNGIADMAMDGAGNLYIVDSGRIRKRTQPPD